MKRPNKLFAAFLSAVLCMAMLGGCVERTDEAESKAETQTESTVSVTAESTQSITANSDNISIPGYEALEFTAGETEQPSRFYNPEENACIFRLTLSIDGETLWESEDIAPGEKLSSMTLTRPLDAGEYNAKLKYDCFTLQDKTPLNGAEIELAINVK